MCGRREEVEAGGFAVDIRDGRFVFGMCSILVDGWIGGFDR